MGIRLRNKPNRTKLLSHWVRAVLVQHSSYLTTVPAAAVVISEFFDTVDQRLKVMPHLMQLHGRLQLITSHISKAAESRIKSSSGGASVVFDEPAKEMDESS